MPKKYQPAVFQPTIRPSWSGSLEYINADELAQILKAIASFPNIDVPDSAFWNQTVKPDLEQQFLSFKETCESRGRGARTYWGEHKLSLCSTYDNHKDTESITQGNLCKDKDKDKNKFNVNSIICVNGQYFDEFPPESISLLKKHWSADEIENMRKELTCKPDHQTTVAQLLLEYPPKPKTTRFVKPTVEEIKAYCEERKNSVDPDSFFNYYESKGWLIGKVPMKDWKAAVRTWEKNNYNQPKKDNFAFTTDSTKSFLNDKNGGF